MIKLQFTNQEASKIYNNELPKYETSGAVGFDIRSVETKYINPHSRLLFKTGLKIQMPDDVNIETRFKNEIKFINHRFELQIRTRSGFAIKNGIIVLNSPGTIDADYRQEIGVIIFNSSNDRQLIESGTRIAQGVFNLVPIPTFELGTVEENGRGGFGSTGTN